MQATGRGRSPGPVAIGVAVWALVAVAGFAAIERRASTPGPVGPAGDRWPAGSRVPLAADGPTLVMAIHPGCPCTRASVTELARVLARGATPARADVLVYRPEGRDRDDGPLVRRLAAIPGVVLRDDPGGVEAARFGALTSGTVAVYAPDGRRLYRGGITGARGHEGDNRGAEALAAALAGEPTDAELPTFGCALDPPP